MNTTTHATFLYRIVRILAVVSCFAYAASSAANSRIALVIGNGNYHTMSDLASPERDANGMAEKLKSIGFSLVGDKAHIDVTRESMLGLLTNLRLRTSNARTDGNATPIALFYYSGHGASHDKDNWLIPVDDTTIENSEDLPTRAIGTKSVLENLPEWDGLNLVVLDACRNNELTSRRKSVTKSSRVPKGLIRPEAPGISIVYAAQEGEVAYADSSGGLSPFTKALLENIDKRGLSVLDVMQSTAAAVVKATKGAQRPEHVEADLSKMRLHKVSFLNCLPQDPNCGKVDPIDPVKVVSIDPVKVDPIDPAKEMYDNAHAIGTINAYYSVVRKYPDSHYAILAQIYIDDIAARQMWMPDYAGTNVLKGAELRWCLRQKRWVAAYLQIAQTRQLSTDAYNRLVDVHAAGSNAWKNRCEGANYNARDYSDATRWISQHSEWIAVSLPKW